MVSLSEYDSYDTDDGVTRMQLSLRDFVSIRNTVYFQKMPTFLLFNKQDRFEELIKTRPLSSVFPEYSGGTKLQDAIKFVQTLFEKAAAEESPNTSPIYTFAFSAVDPDDTSKVFAAIKEKLLEVVAEGDT